jgi:molecular chaperone GrpE
MTFPENEFPPSFQPDGTAPDSPAPAAASAETAEQRLASLEARHNELNDAFLRAKAEAENARRRADEEVSKAR